MFLVLNRLVFPDQRMVQFIGRLLETFKHKTSRDVTQFPRNISKLINKPQAIHNGNYFVLYLSSYKRW